MRIYKCPRCGYTKATENEIWECPECASALLVKYINMDKIEQVVSTYFTYTDSKVEDSILVFKVQPSAYPFKTIKEAFEKEGFYPFLREKDNQHYLILAEKMRQGPPNIMWNLILFVATIASTLFAGYILSLGPVSNGLMNNVWVGAISFSASIMFILGTHEMGHKYASQRNGVDATWPYFIPMPFIIIGTMGAIIKSRSPMPNNDAMIQLGASGPLSGFLVAVPLYILGLKLSYVVPEISGEGVIYFGESLLTRFLGEYIIRVPEGYSLFLHPVAIAAWAALLVTAVNLIPVGQLDGGHVLRAVLGERLHWIVSHILVGIMVLIGFPYYNPFFVWEGWLIWALLLYFVIMRAGSSGAMNELKPVSGFSKGLAVATMAVFILTVIPIPLQIG
jgi:membrane-associated protease RseP (regulator of RpoE activity)/DNA-directed RNA polymerase subunit RPC12/RpoP